MPSDPLDLDPFADSPLGNHPRRVLPSPLDMIKRLTAVPDHLDPQVDRSQPQAPSAGDTPAGDLAVQWTALRLSEALARIWDATPGPRRQRLSATPWSAVLPTVGAGASTTTVARMGNRLIEWRGLAAAGAIHRLRVRARPDNLFRGDAVLIPWDVEHPADPLPDYLIRTVLAQPDVSTENLELYLRAAMQLADQPRARMSILSKCISGQPPKAVRTFLAAHSARFESSADEFMPKSEGPASRVVNVTQPSGMGQWLGAFQDAIHSGKVIPSITQASAAKYVQMVRAVIRNYERHDGSSEAAEVFLQSRPAYRSAWRAFVAWVAAEGGNLPPVATATEACLPPDATTPVVVPEVVAKEIRRAAAQPKVRVATAKDFRRLSERGSRPLYTAASLLDGSLLHPAENPTPPVGAKKAQRHVDPDLRAQSMQVVHQRLAGELDRLPEFEGDGAWNVICDAFAYWCAACEGYDGSYATQLGIEMRVALNDVPAFTPDRGHPLIGALIADQNIRHQRTHQRWVWRRFAHYASDVRAPWSWLFPRLRPYGVRALDAIPSAVQRAMAWLVLWKRRPSSTQKLGELKSTFGAGTLSLETIRALTPEDLVRDKSGAVTQIRTPKVLPGARTFYTIPPEARGMLHILLAWRRGLPGTPLDPTTLPDWPYAPLTDQDPLLVMYPGVPMAPRATLLSRLAKQAVAEAQAGDAQLAKLRVATKPVPPSDDPVDDPVDEPAPPSDG